MTLEKVLGITTSGNSGLTCDPRSGLVAYPAGWDSYPNICSLTYQQQTWLLIISTSGRRLVCTFLWSGIIFKLSEGILGRGRPIGLPQSEKVQIVFMASLGTSFMSLWDKQLKFSFRLRSRFWTGMLTLVWFWNATHLLTCCLLFKECHHSSKHSMRTIKTWD